MSKVVIQREDGTTGDLGVGPDGYAYLMEGETVVENPDNVKIHHPTKNSDMITIAKGGGIVIAVLVMILIGFALGG